MPCSGVVWCGILLAVLALWRNVRSPSSSWSILFCCTTPCTLRVDDLAVVLVPGVAWLGHALDALAVVLRKNVILYYTCLVVATTYV